MIFLRNTHITSAPWTVHDDGRITTSWGALIAVLPTKENHCIENNTLKFTLSQLNIDSAIDKTSILANAALIAAAPELLSALKEAAFHLESAGIPLNQSYYDLINKAQYGVEDISPKKTVDKNKSFT